MSVSSTVTPLCCFAKPWSLPYRLLLAKLSCSFSAQLLQHSWPFQVPVDYLPPTPASSLVARQARRIETATKLLMLQLCISHLQACGIRYKYDWYSPAVQPLVAGAAVADVSKPVLPGADVTSKDLPNGPKPLEALKGDAGSKVQAIMVTKLHRCL